MDQLDDDFTLTEDTAIVEKKRPAFLLVLCILTFIASGFGLIMGLVNFAGFNDVESQLRNASVGANPFAREVFDSLDIDRIQSIQDWANILGVIASVLCLTGALLMFKMRKIGFLPYVGISIMKEMTSIMPVAEMGDMMTMMGGIVMVFVVIIAIAFIIMYGVNLKHLK